MIRIGQVLREINKNLERIEVFYILIKTLVILMVFYLCLFILNIKPYFAFIPAIIYLVSSLFVDARIDKVRRVEEKYGELNEKLRTARDYQYKDSPILDELEEEIIVSLKSVRISTFFSVSKTTILVFMLILAVSSSLYISSKDRRLIDFNEILDAAIKNFLTDTNQTDATIDFTSSEESFMRVGNEKINVEINPVGMDIDFSQKTEDAEYEFSTAFPKDIFISSSVAYENEFTEEQQALIKRYFDKKNTEVQK